MFRHCRLSRLHSNLVGAASHFHRSEIGKRNEEGWAMFYHQGDADTPRVSAWHSLPLKVKGDTEEPLFHFINEIPKGTRAKLEIATKVEHNPIMQDRVKKTNALRYFTYGDIPFNYGCLPQTWEDPKEVDPDTKCHGDNDPVDVVELGAPLEVGLIAPVRLLGVLAMIDEGETDWKVVVSRCNSPFKTLSDVPVGVLDEIRHWFRYYKTTDGKPENVFAFDAQFKGEDMALAVVERLQEQWRQAVETNRFPSLGLK